MKFLDIGLKGNINIKKITASSKKVNNYTQLHNGDYYTSEYYHIYKYIINKYKRAHIMWPLPKEIIFNIPFI